MIELNNMILKFMFCLILLLNAHICYANSFNDFKKSLVKNLPKYGIKKSTIKQIAPFIKYNKKISKIYFKQRKPIKENLNTYINKWIKIDNKSDETLITKGKKLLKLHSVLLKKIEEKYKVDKEILIALWGIETKFGDFTGTYNVFEALATLAYMSKRKKIFQKRIYKLSKITSKI